MPYIALTVTEAGHNSSNQMLEAKKQRAAARSEGHFYESKCATLDRQIDNWSMNSMT